MKKKKTYLDNQGKLCFTILPEEEKKTTYHILRWIMREFNSLRLKDNLDVGFKKIRFAEYIASLYAFKIAQGIYRVSDANRKARTILEFSEDADITFKVMIRTPSMDKTCEYGISSYWQKMPRVIDKFVKFLLVLGVGAIWREVCVEFPLIIKI